MGSLLSPNRRAAWWIDAALVAAGALCCAAVFGNAVTGDFVSDDRQQIAGNPLIWDPRFFWKAIASDAWAFKVTTGEPSSLYYRPASVLWMIASYRLFGLNPLPWHIMNVLLHAAVAGAAYVLLRQLRIGRPASAGLMILFAVHPAHVESVAWVSSWPDLLVGLTLLPSLTLVVSGHRDPRAWKWTLARALYAVGVFSKEIAVVFPAIVFIAVLALDWGIESRRTSAKRAAVAALPFAAIALVYLLVRLSVLGKLGLSGRPGLGLDHVITTAPSLVAFYARQVFLPLWIAPAYPLRPVTGASLGWANFYLPLLVSTAIFALVVRVMQRDPVRWIGLGIAVLLLLPAFNITALFPEQMVHDRYLYLPLLGALMLAWVVVDGALRRAFAGDARRAGRAFLVLACAAAVPLAWQSVRYNRTWRTELALWDAAVRSDPGSMLNHNQLGVALRQAGRLDEARAEFDRAIAIAPHKLPYLGRASLDLRLGRPEAAERHFRLGLLHAEMGHGRPAREALGEFLELTARFRTPDMQARRAEARRVLGRL